jgi:hypothetical protein
MIVLMILIRSHIGARKSRRGNRIIESAFKEIVRNMNLETKIRDCYSYI